MSTSVPSGVIPLKETPKQAKVRIAAKLGLEITGTEREIAQRIKDFKATAGSKRKGPADSQVSKRRRTGAEAAQSGDGSTTQAENEDSQLQLIDPALLALSAGHCAKEQSIPDEAPDNSIARIQFNDARPIHAQMDFLAHQTAADSRKAEPKASDATYRRHIHNYENFIVKWNERQQTIPEATQLALEEEGEQRLQAALGTLDPFPITADKAFFFVNMEKERGLGVSAIKQLTGYRGANVRQLQWSHVRFKKIPVLELGASQDGVAEVNSLTFWANCHNHNQNGNVEEVSLFRHRDPALCSVYALASYFFYYFHAYGCPRPVFAPDYERTNAESYGYREWFHLQLFYGHDKYKPLGYAGECAMNVKVYCADAAAKSTKLCLMVLPRPILLAHNSAYSKVFSACDIVSQKKTHATRVYMATSIRQNGAQESSVKAHGGWFAGSSFGSAYAKHTPVDAIVAAAGFSGKDPST
ncbi:hypothetical protein QFC24_005400 [Naganishia onofrii]|uniref:Uncharacterized protein n=1 Tax=Naganishia onofrii TaxID=1851511 RepID=A0ACC2X7P0_9TREE|nr:hypothetical protein QFC24_005400 [Naganishia onofrii]